MPRTSNLRLVIDTDVLAASSTRGGRCCLEALETIRQMRYKIVRTPQLMAEGARHSSAYSIKWLAVMKKKRRIFEPVGDLTNATLRQRICEAARDDRDWREMEKDMHLIEAALASGRRIISRENNARNRFLRIVPQVRPIGQVAWKNPEKAEHCTIDWLRNGASLNGHLLADEQT